VLPWEDESEYEKLLNAIVTEYKPQGPIEEHLVEEITGIIWRKRRLRMAEQAAHFRALHRAVHEQYPSMSGAALVLTAPGFVGRTRGFEGRTRGILNADEDWKVVALAKLQDNEARAVAAFNILNTSDGTYERGLSEFNNGQKEEFKAYERMYSPNSSRILIEYIKGTLFPAYRDQRLEIEHYSLIRYQALGESVDTAALEPLGRQEVRLDRKLERNVAMLVKLQSMRAEINMSASGQSLVVHP
jgi:hypothetical protein